MYTPFAALLGHRRISVAAIALLAFGAFFTAHAQTPNSSNPAPRVDAGNPANKSPSGTPTDADFLKVFAKGGMAEVEVGKLAEQRAGRPDVKRFAQQMVQDHTKTNAQLASLAKEKNVALPAKIDDEHAGEKAKLEGQKGADFDAEYMRGQVRDHQKAVQLLQHQINSGQDPTINTFARETLIAVQHHLEMAREILSKNAEVASDRLPSTLNQTGRASSSDRPMAERGRTERDPGDKSATAKDRKTDDTATDR